MHALSMDMVSICLQIVHIKIFQNKNNKDQRNALTKPFGRSISEPESIDWWKKPGLKSHAWVPLKIILGLPS